MTFCVQLLSLSMLQVVACIDASTLSVACLCPIAYLHHILLTRWLSLGNFGLFLPSGSNVHSLTSNCLSCVYVGSHVPGEHVRDSL